MSLEPRAHVIRRAVEDLGLREGSRPHAILMRQYWRVAQIAESEQHDRWSWCMIWAHGVIRSRRHDYWQGSVTECRAWLDRRHPHEVLPVDAALPGDLVGWTWTDAAGRRRGHCGIALAERGRIRVEANAGALSDRVLITHAPMPGEVWAWRWW